MAAHGGHSETTQGARPGGYVNNRAWSKHMAKTKGCRVNKTNEPIQTSKDHERDIRCSNCNKLFDVMKADVGLPTTPNTLTGLKFQREQKGTVHRASFTSAPAASMFASGRVDGVNIPARIH